MLNVYYTVREGRRNRYGHTTSRGDVYIVHGDALVSVGDYVHHSGGADISSAVLAVLEAGGIDTNGGYYHSWQDAIKLIEI